MTSLRLAGFTVADVAFLLVFLLVLLQRMQGPAAAGQLAPAVARRTPPVLVVGLGMLTLGGLLATFLRSLDPVGSALVLARLWYITIIWFWTLRSVCRDWRDLRRLLAALLVGVAINSLIGAYQEATGANQGDQFHGRSAGLTEHFNALGISVAATVPLLVMWRTESSRPSARRIRWVGLLVMLVGVGASGSMTAFLAMVAGTAVALFVPSVIGGSRKTRRGLMPAVLGGLVVGGVLVSGVVSLDATERFTKWREGNSYVESSIGIRDQLADAAIESAVASPLFGVGLDSTSSSIEVQGGGRASIHSLYLRALYEAGILGLFGVVTIFVTAFHSALAAATYLRRRGLDWIPIGLLGSTVVLCADAFFSPPLFERFFWAPFGLIAATVGLCRADSLRPRDGRIDDVSEPR